MCLLIIHIIRKGRKRKRRISNWICLCCFLGSKCRQSYGMWYSHFVSHLLVHLLYFITIIFFSPFEPYIWFMVYTWYPSSRHILWERTGLSCPLHIGGGVENRPAWIFSLNDQLPCTVTLFVLVYHDMLAFKLCVTPTLNAKVCVCVCVNLHILMWALSTGKEQRLSDFWHAGRRRCWCHTCDKRCRHTGLNIVCSAGRCRVQAALAHLY